MYQLANELEYCKGNIGEIMLETGIFKIFNYRRLIGTKNIYYIGWFC